MTVETEVKIRLSDLPGFRDRLRGLGAVLLSPCHFEDNHVLDFQDGRLRSRKCLMRVRIAGGSAWITFKGPPLRADLFKKRDEWETSVQDGSLLLRILQESGMMVWLWYQKRREEYTLDAIDGTRVGQCATNPGPHYRIYKAGTMSSLNSRLAKLEAEQPDKNKYVCVIYSDQEQDGYTVVEYGGANPQHFATRQELDDFGARPGVDLLIVEVEYVSM